MKIRIKRVKNKGIRGRVVGIYMDGRYDINVIKPRQGQPKQMVVSINSCQEIK